MDDTVRRLSNVESDVSNLKLQVVFIKLLIASVLVVGVVSFALAKLVH